MEDNSNKTLVCSVLFLDIVEYSNKSVSEQLRLKQRFNAALVRALQQVAQSDRIVLDTGDGAAICFLGSPETPMFVSMDVRDAIAQENQKDPLALLLRMGINLGPIRLIKDINAQVNIIGDGINVAERVMGFAKPGDILVSRPYYEVVSRLSDDYARILQYEGSRTDKHVREHEVYAVGAGQLPKTSDASLTASSGFQAAGAGSKKNGLWVGVVAASVVIVGLAFWLRSSKTTDSLESKTAPSVAETSSASTPVAVVAKLSPQPTATKKLSPEFVKSAQMAASKPVAVSKPGENLASSPPAVKQAEVTVLLRIQPWGEVYVNGQLRGISPPLKSLTLAPGTHMIEVKNTGLPSHVHKIEAKSGAQIKVDHTFSAN